MRKRKNAAVAVALPLIAAVVAAAIGCVISLSPILSAILLSAHRNSVIDSVGRGDDDGCGMSEPFRLHASATLPQLPRWRNYTVEESDLYRRVETCYKRIGIDTPGDKHPQPPPLSKLVCRREVPDIDRVLSSYERVWFLGDSVMRQLFTALVCLADPNQQPVKNTYGDGRSRSAHANFTVQYRQAGTNASKTTLLTYLSIGRNWDKAETRLYSSVLPPVVHMSTSRDALIINTGLHYSHEFGPELQNAVSFIGNMSQMTDAAVYFLEAPDEQWPTSNGGFTKACMWQCKCEALSLSRVAGEGAMLDHSKFVSNITGDKDLHSYQKSDRLISFYGGVYPELDLSFKELSQSDAFERVPSYLPATWRNDVANSILRRKAPQVTIVPVWKQLVARQLPHGRRDGDCGHKSLGALLAINEQLLRSIATSRS